MKRIRSTVGIIIVAISIMTANCSAIADLRNSIPQTTEYVELTQLTDYPLHLYHVTYRGHEFIVNSNGGLIELTTQPYDTFKESTK